ncbi:hypothetical protein ACHAW6_008222 [Cyclotella cf. meneghiniana]
MKSTKSGTKTSKQGKNDGRPTRPLNAYNIFFAIERRKIVSKQQKEAAMDGCTSTTSRRRREQAHVGFANLARIVSDRWKTIDEGYKAELEEKARLDKIRYENEMKQWISEQQRNKDGFGDRTTVTNVNTTFDTPSDKEVVGVSNAVRSSKASSRCVSKAMSIPKSCNAQHESKTDDSPAPPRSFCELSKLNETTPSLQSQSLHWERSFPSTEQTQEEPSACSTEPLPHHFYCAPCFTPISSLSGEDQDEFSIWRRFPVDKRKIDANNYEFDTIDPSRNPSGNRIIPANPPRSDGDKKNENIPTSYAQALQSSNSADVDYFDFEPLPYQHFSAANSSSAQEQAQGQANISTKSYPSNQHDFNVTSVWNPIELGSYENLGHSTPLDLHNAQNERSGWNIKSDTAGGPILPSDRYHFCDAPCTTQAQAFGYTYDLDIAPSSTNPSSNLSFIPANPPPRQYEHNGNYTTSKLMAHHSSKSVDVSYFGFEPSRYQNVCSPFSLPTQAPAQASVATRSLPRNEDELNATFFRNSIELGSYANLGYCMLDPHHTGMKSDLAARQPNIADGNHPCFRSCDTQATATICKNSHKFTDASCHTWGHNEGVPSVKCIDDKCMTSPSQHKPLDLSAMSESVVKQSIHYRDSMNEHRSSMPLAMAALSPAMATGHIGSPDHNRCDLGDPSNSSAYSIDEIRDFFVAVRRNSCP